MCLVMKRILIISSVLATTWLVGCSSPNPAKYADAERPLHAAVIEGKQAYFNKFLEQEPDVDAPNQYGETSLHLAARYKRSEMLDALINKEADLDKVGDERNSALHYAVMNHPQAYTLTDQLLNADANPNLLNRELQSPMHLTLDPKMLTKLLKKGGDPTLEDYQGYTPVLRAMLNTQTRVSDVQYLDLFLEHGLDPDHVYPVIDQVLIHWAIEKGRMDIFDQVMAHKADPNLLDRKGRPPLFLAMTHSRSKMTTSLLKSGANANARRYVKGNASVHESLLNAAVRRLDIYSATLLIKYGARVNGAGFSADGSSALYNLCRMRTTPAQRRAQLEMFNLLINSGANPNMPLALGDNSFPLHAAVKMRNVMLVERLLELGASVNARSVNEETPLHLAAKTGDLNLIQRLIRGGATRLAQNEDGKTPGRIAFEGGYLEVASLLNR